MGAAPGDGQFQRGAVETVLFMWDLKKPVIAQVHGHCLAGVSEIASGADLVYVAESGLDPIRWKFEGSDDGEKWIALQDKSDMDWPTPIKRLYTSGVLGLDGGAA